MYTVNWDKVQLEIRPRKHKYHIREGSPLEGIVLVACLIILAGTMLYWGS